jgi:hypothetical protein
MDYSQFVDSALLAVITAFIGFLVKFGFNLYNIIKVNKKVVSFKVIAEEAVKSSEQIFKDPKSGNEKFDFASKALVAFAQKEFKVTLDENTVKMFIESAVNTFVDDVKKEVAAPVEDAKAEQK